MSVTIPASVHSAECIEAHLTELREQLRREMHGKTVLTRKASMLMKRIGETELRLEQALHPAQASLGQLLPDDTEVRNRIYRLLVKVPLAADLLYDILVELQGEVRTLGLSEVTLTEAVDKARKAVSQLVFFIDTDKLAGLQKILSADSELINQQTVLLDRFLDGHMEVVVTDKNNKV